tara:strand:+ start:251 stop:436 length:186 start_codon:yes stop_codon:yes gene_type:complete
MQAILSMIASRAKEPSTMASVGVLLSALGLQLPEAVVSNVIAIGGAAAALLGMLISEKGKQ